MTVTHAQRLAWAEADESREDNVPRTTPPDKISEAVAALADEYGWYCDPVFSPDEVLALVEKVAAVLGYDGEPTEGVLPGQIVGPWMAATEMIADQLHELAEAMQASITRDN